MGGPEHFFFDYQGEIAHSPKKPRSQRLLEHQNRLPNWTGDESNGIESTRELSQTRTDLDQRNAGNGIPDGTVVYVDKMTPERFDLMLKDIH